MDVTNTSPFIEGTHYQWAWDSTSLSWLKECPRKYQYTMIDGWRLIGDSIHLKFGILYHSALEAYDRLRITEDLSHDDALEAIVDYLLKKTWEDGKPWETNHSKKNRDTLLRSVIWYLDEFQNDPAKTIILPDGKPAVELSFKMEINHDAPDGNTYVLSGRLDRLVRFGDEPYVMDRKTTGSTLGSYYFSEYSPHNQMSLYTLAGRVVFATPVAGVIIDAAQIAVGFSSFGRGITTRSAAQLDEYLENTVHWLKQAERYAAEGYWPMNEMSCHKYGGCPFREVCNKSPEIRGDYLKTYFEKKPWNPLEVRE